MTKELLDSGTNFTAVYAIADSMAIGSCRALKDAGKNVPEDYSVAGFDGLELGQYYIPSLTTIRQPVEDMAKATIRILFDIIKHRSIGETCLFEGTLLDGESVKDISE